MDCILIFSVNLHFDYLKINLLYLKAKLLEGDFGAKCSAGKFAAAILNEMGKQVLLSLNQHQIKFEQEQIGFNRCWSQGKSTVAATWSESGLSWAEFLPSATEVLLSLSKRNS